MTKEWKKNTRARIYGYNKKRFIYVGYEYEEEHEIYFFMMNMN